MPIALEDLPKVIILEPGRGVRIEVRLEASACEIDAHLEKEGAGRSFVLMIAHPNGEVVQRVRVAGHAKVLFDPETPGEYVFLLTNPMSEPAIVRWEVRAVEADGPKGKRRGGPKREYDPAFR